MGVDVSRTLAALGDLGKRMDTAAFNTVKDGLDLIQLSARAKAPVGTPGNSTNAPGDLGRSIEVEGPAGDGGIYSGKVGPTVIYGRQRELGGDIYKSPGWMKFMWGDKGLTFAHHVYQKPEPYLKPATEEQLPNLEVLAYEHALAAIEG